MIRLYRKSDSDLVAAVIEERDQLAKELATEKAEHRALKLYAEEIGRRRMECVERIRELEEAQQKHVTAQQGTIDKLLSATVESNAPVNWPDREPMKITTPPRSVMATMKDRAIKSALQNQKKPPTVQ